MKKNHRVNGQPYATLTDPATSTDVGRGLIADGILLVEKRREKKLKSLVNYFVYFVNCYLDQHVDRGGETRVAGYGLW